MVLQADNFYSLKHKTDLPLQKLKFTEVIDIRKCRAIKQETCGTCGSNGKALECIFVLKFENGRERKFHSQYSMDSEIAEWLKIIKNIIIQNTKLNITINIIVDNRYRFNQTCNITKSYTDDKSLKKSIATYAMNTMHKKHHPMHFEFEYIHTPEKKTKKKYYSYYYRTKLIRNVHLKIKPVENRNRALIGSSILCDQGPDCTIYKDMRLGREMAATNNNKNLQHLMEYTHCNNILEKPECKLNEKCDAYIRLESGGNKLTDMCHMQIYRHPPRQRQIKLAENFSAFVMNTHHTQNEPVYNPSKSEKKTFNENDGYLKQIIKEVIRNGFEEDLCLSDDDKQNKQHSILCVVDNKLNSPKHKSLGLPLNKGEMLSLVMYTQCDCNYDLCESQRHGNYQKWKWFDYCLYNAICKLSVLEVTECKLYSGVGCVQFKTKNVKNGYFVTFVSSTWRREVALNFMAGEGMIIEIDESIQSDPYFYSCDVSWISKYPYEGEILIARSTGKLFYVDNKCYDKQYKTDNQFEGKIIDQNDEFQTVLLFQSEKYITNEIEKQARDQQYDPCGNDNDSLQAIE